MIDVTSVVIDEEKQLVLITGLDLDSIWTFTDEPEEDAECKELTYSFDYSLVGVRKYLYILTKNNKKANEFAHMNQRLEALVGEALSFSSNFLLKD